MQKRITSRILGAAAMAALTSTASAAAWDNGSGDGKWNTTSLNWEGAAFVAGADAIFGDTGAGVVVLQDSGGAAANLSAGVVGFTGASDYTIGSLDASNFATDGVLTLSGTLTQSGAGSTLFIHGGHTFSGITVSAGTLRLRSNYPTTAVGGTFDNNTVGGPVTINAGTLQVEIAATKIGGSNGDVVSVSSQTLGTAAIQLNGGELALRTRDANNRAVDWSANNVTVAGDSSITVAVAPGSVGNTMVVRLGMLSIGNHTLTNTTHNGNNLRFSGDVTLTGSATFNVANGTTSANMNLAAGVFDGGNGYDLIKTGNGTLSLNNDNGAARNDFGRLIIEEGSVTYRGGSLAANRQIIVGAASEGTGPRDARLQPSNRTADNPVWVRSGNSGRAEFGFGSSNAAAVSGVVTLDKTLYLVPAGMPGGSSQTMTLGSAIATTNGTGYFTGAGGVVVDLGTSTASTPANRIALFTGTVSNDYAGQTIVNSGTLRLQKGEGAIAIPGDLLVGDGAGTLRDIVEWYAADQIADAANVTIAGNGLLDLRGFNEAFATLTITGNGQVATGTDGVLTVMALTVGGVPYADGIYDAATSSAFIGGTGSIVVMIPEPASASLLAVGTLLLGRRRRGA